MWKSTVDWRIARGLEVRKSAVGWQKVVVETRAIRRKRKKVDLVENFILNELVGCLTRWS